MEQKLLTNTMIVTFCAGAFLLAAIYHTILYLHRREPLLRSYSIYLWCVAIYVGFRSFTHLAIPFIPGFETFPLDECLQMITFIAYIRFVGFAMELSAADNRLASFFWKHTAKIIILYLILLICISWAELPDMTVHIPRTCIRAYLLFVGLTVVIMLMPRRSNLFFRYLAAGAIALILFGITSSVFGFKPTGAYYLYAYTILSIGYFFDVVFFSAAVGYRIKQESHERLEALQTIVTQQQQLQQKEIEKIQAVFKTKEEERMRIAQDLHDDIGSTLSSIHIYTQVANEYVSSDPQKARSFLSKINEGTGQIMDNISELIWSLQTNYGRGQQVHERIGNFALEMLSSAGIEPQLNIHPLSQPISVAAQKSIWLAAKEMINNVCKYSKAERCRVRFEEENDLLVIEVCDNGVGFDIDRIEGNGVKNMKARCAHYNGRLRIDATAGKGVQVSMQVPLTEIRDSPAVK